MEKLEDDENYNLNISELKNGSYFIKCSGRFINKIVPFIILKWFLFSSIPTMSKMSIGILSKATVIPRLRLARQN